MDLQKLQKELPKYQIRFAGLSIFPFFYKLEIYYLPLGQKVGEITGYFSKVNGYLNIVEPAIYVEFRDNKWKFEMRGIF